MTCPKSDSVVVRPCELDRPIAERERSERSPRPFYPDILRQAGVSGEVLLRYVVDTNGRAVPASTEIIRSTHALFATAVKNSLPRQRFEPPQRAGVLTEVMVEELVTFMHPAPGRTSVRQQHVAHRSADSTGRLLTTVYAFTPRDSMKAPVLTSADSLEIYEAVIEDLRRTKVVDTPPAAWCVQLDGRAPASQMLVRWRRNGRRVVGIADCPPTYASMIYSPSRPKPPPGWIDPVRFDADSLVSWAEDTVVLTTNAAQGTAITVRQCEAVRVGGKWAQVFCVTTHMRIS